MLDERDALIRSKLSSVKDNTGDVDKLAAEAQEILKVGWGWLLLPMVSRAFLCFGFCWVDGWGGVG